MQEAPILLTNRFVAGPFPYIPGVKILKKMVKLERKFEATPETHTLIRNRIMKKYASMERRMRKLMGK
jgi:hypothetical protein